jgi:hypothetical protein
MGTLQKAIDKYQANSLNAALWHFTPVFTKDLTARYCFVRALQQTKVELESMQLSSSNNVFVPEIELTNPTYKELSIKYHYSTGYETGTSLC